MSEQLTGIDIIASDLEEYHTKVLELRKLMNQRSNCWHSLDHKEEEKLEFRKYLLLFH